MLSNLSTSQFGSESATLSALFGGPNPPSAASVYGALHPSLTSSGSFPANGNLSHLTSKPFPSMFSSTGTDSELSLSLPYPQNTATSGFDSSQLLQLKSSKERSLSKSSSPTLSPGSMSSANACLSSGHGQSEVRTALLYGIPIVSLVMDNQERLCLAQISNTLLKTYSYNEIHNRRVALGITCVQCTPVQLELLRRAGAMPVSSRRCGMITKREAERLCKSFLTETAPPKLPENFSFDVYHCCAWGCRGCFTPSRYNSSRAKCIKCIYCGLFFSPNKFIFHSHRLPTSKYVQPDAANFNSWRRHIRLVESPEPTEQIVYAWEDVKAMFNGGSRKRAINSTLNSFTKNQEHQNSKNAAKKSRDMEEMDEDSDSIGVTDDIDPSASSFDMTDILDGDQNSEESLNVHSKGPAKSMHSLRDRATASPSSPSPVVGSGKSSMDSSSLTSSSGSKPFWSMEAYLASTNPLSKSSGGRHNSFGGSYSESLMHSAYPFIPRSSTTASLPEARGHTTTSSHPHHHPAILNTILNNVPENYHFRQSLLSGYVPGATSGPAPSSDLSPGKGVPGAPTGPSFAELMWSMAARNGAAAAAALGGTSGLTSSLSPYNLLSWSAQSPSQNAARSLLPSPASAAATSHFDTDELRKALLLNPGLFPSRSQADFFSSPEFPFLPPFRPLLDSPSSFETEKAPQVKRQKTHDEGAKRIKISPTSKHGSESDDQCKNDDDEDGERNEEMTTESNKSHQEKLNNTVEQ